jgi:hypothetical protein
MSPVGHAALPVFDLPGQIHMAGNHIIPVIYTLQCGDEADIDTIQFPRDLQRAFFKQQLLAAGWQKFVQQNIGRVDTYYATGVVLLMAGYLDSEQRIPLRQPFEQS